MTPKPFRIYVAGCWWSGDWSVERGELCLRSAYGARRCALGRRKPERLAEELLREVLCERAEAGRLTPPC